MEWGSFQYCWATEKHLISQAKAGCYGNGYCVLITIPTAAQHTYTPWHHPTSACLSDQDTALDAVCQICMWTAWFGSTSPRAQVTFQPENPNLWPRLWSSIPQQHPADQDEFSQDRCALHEQICLFALSVICRILPAWTSSFQLHLPHAHVCTGVDTPQDNLCLPCKLKISCNSTFQELGDFWSHGYLASSSVLHRINCKCRVLCGTYMSVSVSTCGGGCVQLCSWSEAADAQVPAETFIPAASWVISAGTPSTWEKTNDDGGNKERREKHEVSLRKPMTTDKHPTERQLPG